MPLTIARRFQIARRFTMHLVKHENSSYLLRESRVSRGRYRLSNKEYDSISLSRCILGNEYSNLLISESSISLEIFMLDTNAYFWFSASPGIPF